VVCFTFLPVVARACQRLAQQK